jgi:hypothetical protein
LFSFLSNVYRLKYEYNNVFTANLRIDPNKAECFGKIDVREPSDIVRPFRGLSQASAVTLDLDGRIDVTGKGYPRPMSDFTSVWSSTSDENRNGTPSVFGDYGYQTNQNGSSNTSQSFSSGQYQNVS